MCNQEDKLFLVLGAFVFASIFMGIVAFLYIRYHNDEDEDYWIDEEDEVRDKDGNVMEDEGYWDEDDNWISAM